MSEPYKVTYGPVERLWDVTLPDPSDAADVMYWHAKYLLCGLAQLGNLQFMIDSQVIPADDPIRSAIAQHFEGAKKLRDAVRDYVDRTTRSRRDNSSSSSQ